MITVPGRVEVVATVGTEDEALGACDRHRIDIALIDLQLAQGTGFGVIRHLRDVKSQRPTAIIVLTNHAVPALKVAAFEAGADYFFDKSTDFSSVSRVIGELLQQTEFKSVAP
jgi:DNA-binding NarL/FixJ family response regulator